MRIRISGLYLSVGYVFQNLFGALIIFVHVLLFAGLASVVMHKLVQPTQTGKFFAFVYILFVLVTLLLIHKLIIKQKQRVTLTIIDIFLGVLFSYIAFNRYIFQDTFSFSLSFYELIGLGVLYILLRQLEKNIYVWLLIAVIISGLIQALYGNLQLLEVCASQHSAFKLTGSFFNPGPYSGFLAVAFTLSIGIYTFKLFDKNSLGYLHSANDSPILYKLRRSKIPFVTIYWITVLCIIVILLVLPASQSRAAWVGAAIGCAYLLVIKYQWIKRTKVFINSCTKKIAAAFLLLIITSGTAYELYNFKPESAEGRVLIWKVAASMFSDSPWIGHGFDRFKAGYMNYQAAYFRNNLDNKDAVLADNVYYAFNEPLQFAVENGIVGTLILIALVLSIFISKTVDNKNMVNIAKAGMLAIIVFALFSYPMQILPIKLVGILLIAITASFQKKWNLKRFYWPSSLMIKGIVAGTIIITICLTIPVLSNLREKYKHWATAYSLYQMGAYAQSVELYEKVSTQFAKDGDFLMNYGKALSMAGRHEKAVGILKEAKGHLNNTIIQTALGDSYKALKHYEEAEDAYYQAWYMAPDRFYPKYLLVKLYDENNQKEKAVKTARELIEKEVKVESIAIEEMKEEMEEIIKKSSS